MNNGKILLGVFAGIAVGALAGILFAPDKGSATRKKIVSKGSDYADELKSKFNEYIDAVTRKTASVKEGASDLISSAVSKTDHVKQS